LSFATIRELVERTNLDSRAAECLGLSGALSGIANLNETEAAEYAKDLIRYTRDLEKHKVSAQKAVERNRQRQENYLEKVAARQAKIEEKLSAFEVRLQEWEIERRRREDINTENEASGKRKLAIPPRPATPTLPNEVQPPPEASLQEEPREPPPRRMVLAEKDRVALQRDMLHCYLKGHPLDTVKLPDGVETIAAIRDAENGSCHTVCGALQSLKETQTRSGTLMARLRIEDRSGGIEVVLFQKTYSRVRGSLIKGEVYSITGRIRAVQSASDDDIPLVQIAGQSMERLAAREASDWEVNYPLLKGSVRILPLYRTSTKGNAISIIMRTAREDIGQRGPLQSRQETLPRF
jgi:DNA polymerase III alpha subunit